MKYLKKHNEGFDQNDIRPSIMMVIVTYYLLSGKFEPEYLKGSFDNLKNGFIDFCNLMGYQIDKDYINARLEEDVLKIKDILKIK